MPRDLEYTDKALADLGAIRGWLTQPGAGLSAQQRLLRLWTSIDRLI